ncbi:MAG: transposase DNA-binding-containing protein, partial [Limisphaerales bacterium]
MTNTLLRPTQWAESEFASAQLGDLRRTQRL